MIDRVDGRAVLTALFQRVDAVLGRDTQGRWRCRRAVPRIDGSLYFELVHGGDVFRLDWLGLDLCSFWLSGDTVADLAAVARAGTILSFPYGREAAQILAGSLDLGITNSLGLIFFRHLPGVIPFVELGFPSHHTHALHDEPYMGYKGTLKPVERMANAISHAAVHRKK